MGWAIGEEEVDGVEATVTVEWGGKLGEAGGVGDDGVTDGEGWGGFEVVAWVGDGNVEAGCNVVGW